MKISVKIVQSGEEFIASCPELDINCYAADKEEAINRIINILQFYIDSARELGIEIDNLDKINIEGLATKSLVVNDSHYQSSDAIN